MQSHFSGKRFVMTSWTRICLSLLALTLSATFAFAQGVQTGTLQGTARDTDGLVLPGVTVTVSSPALQGTRTTVTDENGVYVLRGLPGGEYEVVFELTGFATKTERTTVAVGSPSLVNATLGVGGLTETVSVTANPIESIVTSTSGTANFRYMEVQTLPVGRTPQGIAQLSPALTTNTPNAGQLTINGAFAYDNVFLIDGVDVNDNLFGTSNNLFIEDAIEETQVLSSGISAEYGRFSGGVINVVTKSGGDQFSGTFRSNFTNDDWQELSPFEKERNITKSDKVNQSYEGTFGGPILKSRLWFFGAGRFAETTNTAPLPQSGVSFTRSSTNKRGEIKLTGTVANDHTISGSYMNNSTDSTRVPFAFSIDPNVAEEPSFPNDRFVANYRGVLSPRLFADLRASRKTFGFRGAGGSSQNLNDSPIIGLSQLVHYNGNYFDATDPENRNNYQVAGSLSYFLSTANLGSHDIKGGFEVFNSYRTGGNSQSSTGYVIIADYLQDAAGAPVFDSAGRFIPLFEQGATFNENWLANRGAQLDIRTTSFYLQDSWRATSNLTFDIGTRYERVRGEATGGIVPINTDTWVPRLAATYDLKGDGRYVVQSTYAWYAGKYSESQFAGNTDVGNPAAVYGEYVGPTGQGRDFAPGFDPNNYVTYDGSFPTANVFFESGLSSPVTKEFTASFGAQVGRGFAKATFINRNMSNFVEDFITVEGGTTTVTRDGINYGTFQNINFRNSDVPERDYQAVVLQGRYPLFSRLNLYANYTYQIKNDGNFEGEGTNTPGVSSLVGDRPEIYNPARNFPTGRLNDFQSHRIRAWGIYNQPLAFLGDIDVALFYKYDSPLTYSLSASNVALSAIQRQLGAGYISLPATQTLYFGERGSELFDAAHLWDLGLNYSIPVFKSLRPYVKFDLFNVFNNDKLIQWNTVVTADRNSALDSLGLPTGYVQGANFGKGTANTHYPSARRYEIAVGFRF
jgi:hypothetical protein